MAPRAKRFKAVLERGGQALGWTIARVPFDARETWKQMVRLRVRGEVNGFGFRTSLFPDARGGFYLLVNRAMQAGAGVAAETRRSSSWSRTWSRGRRSCRTSWRCCWMRSRGCASGTAALSEYMRREIGKWVMGVKSDAARMGRAEQMAERLLATMEGERELPPAIEAAFRARPKARTGWAKMTPTQRRGELMAVFYYRTVERRETSGEAGEAAESHAK